MKKQLLSLVLGGLVVFALVATASAQTGPVVTSVDPASAPNDLGTPVTIAGTGFAADTDASGTVVTQPSVYLGSVALTDVSWVDSSTLTAVVPWGMDAGTYDLTVVDPDGGTGSLPGAFTVTQGLGAWNAGDLFGGEIDQLLMKPGDPNTLYAMAYGVVGLFRSQDAGQHWTYVSDRVSIDNGKFAVDPQHPDWVYGYAPDGLMVSKDDGSSWSVVTADPWPGAPVIGSPQVFVSPYDPQVLFVGSSSNYGGAPSGAYGLAKSSDGGATWHAEAGMDGMQVQDMAFDPVDHERVALATSDARVFLSRDGGDTWTEVAKPPLDSLGLRGSLRYNPYKSGEVWFDSYASPGGIFKSTDASATGWTNVSQPGNGSASISFAGTDTVYVPGYRTTDGGATWTSFGPSPWYGYGSVLVDSSDTQTVYIGNDEVGVQKSTDGGANWDTKNTGLTGLCCWSMDVSHADPLRVWAAFNGPLGVYRSDDGTNHWSYLHIPGAWNVRQVREDPTDPQRVYVSADPGFFVSEDGGNTWADRGWNASPAMPSGMAMATEADPFQPGHLLSGADSGSYGIGTGVLYSSIDYGVSWQAVTMPQALAQITGIAFDPDTTGTVYVTARGTGVYKSTAGGVNGSWQRIDDLTQAELAGAESVAIATHPQHALVVSTSTQSAYRSLDGGTTWRKIDGVPVASGFMFVDHDSTRLYGRGRGLWSSTDLGVTWHQAAGTLGQLQVMATDYADADGHTVLYAATNGGTASGGLAPSSTAFDASRLFPAATPPPSLLGAGVYRYVTRSVPVSYARTSGVSRYDTAVEVSKAMYPATPTHATTVVIATGQDYPDALCAAPLASAYDAPLLLWNPAGTNATVKSELKRLRIDRAFIVGSTRVVPASAETDIRNVIEANWGSTGQVTRLGGINRYDTARLVAGYVGNRDPAYGTPGWKPTYVVASGRNYPDALSVAPFAAANGMPILLTQPDSLPTETSAAIAARGAAGVLMVGSERAISAGVLSAIPVANKQRLYGDTRYDTCVAIADYARTHGASLTHLGFVLGTNFPDALASGPFLAQHGGITMLTQPAALPSSVSAECGKWRLGIDYVHIIGGANVLPDSTVNQLKTVLGN